MLPSRQRAWPPWSRAAGCWSRPSRVESSPNRTNWKCSSVKLTGPGSRFQLRAVDRRRARHTSAPPTGPPPAGRRRTPPARPAERHQARGGGLARHGDVASPPQQAALHEQQRERHEQQWQRQCRPPRPAVAGTEDSAQIWVVSTYVPAGTPIIAGVPNSASASRNDEDEAGQDRRQHQRQRDAPHRGPAARAQHAGRVLQVRGHLRSAVAITM